MEKHRPAGYCVKPFMLLNLLLDMLGKARRTSWQKPRLISAGILAAPAL
jgi:hypothetical protein